MSQTERQETGDKNATKKADEQRTNRLSHHDLHQISGGEDFNFIDNTRDFFRRAFKRIFG